MSPGMRAARALFPEPEQMANDGTRPKVFNYFLHAKAAIIERETGVAELVEALNDCINDIEEQHHLSLPIVPPAEPTDRDFEVARLVGKVSAALTKATGSAS